MLTIHVSDYKIVEDPPEKHFRVTEAFLSKYLYYYIIIILSLHRFKWQQIKQKFN